MLFSWHSCDHSVALLMYHGMAVFIFAPILLFQIGTGSLKTREKRREGIIPATSQVGPMFSLWLESSFLNRKINELEVFFSSQPFFSLKMLVHSSLVFFSNCTSYQ